ncbi:hypothetical protein FCG86_015860 [Klebsiella pneumoniae]|nr:hypothetical protein [Klebsiella pneumoniae]EIW8782450.1 hypothetical protein [Klebsiella pneumoniae]EIW9277652.1 hypothetical protein [Klebsiella pneumoniae]KAA1499571.1 hypothetical protein F1D54_19345 [Klebsiella pneumoniae]KAA1505240.1 hypothetical protein F1D46_21730 [Klebsiella pneumoniae]
MEKTSRLTVLPHFMTLFLTTANQFNAEKGGRGGESLTISLLLLFFRHLNKAATAGVYQHPQREEPG